MNKEHFLIELKIYLKPLSYQQQAAVLDKYEEIFDERIASGEAEEQIAKSLGKPRSIAEEILQEFDIEVPEKRLTRDGWQEFSPVQDYDPYEKDMYDHPYDDHYDYKRPDKPGVRVLKICALLAFDFLFMFWMFFAFAAVVFSCWLAAVLFLLSPILGVYSVIVGFNDAGLFQLFFSVFLSGAGVIGIMILTPLTRLFFASLKRYIKWHGKVFGGRG
ncbi:DUF1700 domain-containing protein [Enterococcus sp. LJL128]|uniref:DUF1700 domain-containing protein n=1 Tax=Enterococcus sp. LJL51 TaxID=3416656 RepID=UPI003CFBADF8